MPYSYSSPEVDMGRLIPDIGIHTPRVINRGGERSDTERSGRSSHPPREKRRVVRSLKMPTIFPQSRGALRVSGLSIFILFYSK